MEPRSLRGEMMTALYRHFQEFPYAPMDPSQLADICRVTPSELNWNLVYLEKCGFVSLGKAIDAVPPYVACTVDISAAGVDLVEDKTKMMRRFGDRSENG